MKPKYLVYLGLIVMFGSFLFDLIFMGIPYQDPTPEIIDKVNRHYLIKDIIFYSGLFLTCSGITGVIVKKIRSHLLKVRI